MSKTAGSNTRLKHTRSSTPRTRSGCQTCRKRRVKCDEQRPACLKCTQAGWTCDGYAHGKTNSIAGASKSSTDAVLTTLQATLALDSYSIPFRVPGSQRDRQILHYFCVQGSTDFAGWFHSEFWSGAVLRQCQRDGVVRQALVSLGLLHLEYAGTQTSRKSVVGSEALVQYGKALRALRRRLQRPDREARGTALVCCILFYCIEAALGNSDGAMCHLQNGLNLLASGQDERQEKIGDVDAVVRVFEELDLQATFFDDERAPQLVLMADAEEDCFVIDLASSMSFSHLDEAQRALMRLRNGLFRFLTANMHGKPYTKDSIPDKVFRQRLNLTERFNTWLFRFNGLRTRTRVDETCRIQILLIHWHVSVMLLEADYPVDTSVFGANPNVRAREVLDLAESVINHTTNDNSSVKPGKGPRRRFSTETGIVAALFVLAMKCADEYVVARATGLLALCERREGLYDAQSMVMVVERFAAARREKKLQVDEELIGSSFEQVFEDELSGRNLRMDQLAECLDS